MLDCRILARIRLIAAAVAALVAALALAAAGRPANPGPNVSVSVAGSPGSVTLGHYVSYAVTVHNGAKNTVTHLALSAPTTGATSPFPLTYVSASITARMAAAASG